MLSWSRPMRVVLPRGDFHLLCCVAEPCMWSSWSEAAQGQRPIAAEGTWTVPLHSLESIDMLSRHGSCMQAMAMKIARTLLASDTSVDTVDRAERLFSYISSIIKDLPGADEETDEDVSTLPIWDCVQLAALVRHREG